MKLKAVRLSEVGHFRTGVALEGLSGALDVVPGPNEAGKTTIFRAIDALFRQKHSADTGELRGLQPVGGGAPLVEAEFEADGRQWRMRKRYLSAKMAELTDLSDGATLRGADAENRLADLLSGRLDARRMLGLLWVPQRQSVELPELKGELGNGLQQLIEDEIANVAGEGRLRRVRAAVAAALAEMVSKTTRKPAAGTRYKAAIDARDRAAADLVQAEAAHRAGQQRLAALRGAEAEAAVLDSPEAGAARTQRLARAMNALGEARAAQDAVKSLSAEVSARQAELDRVSRDLSDLMAGVDEASCLDATLTEIEPRLGQAAGEVERLTAARAAAEQRLRQTNEAVAALELRAEAFRITEQRQVVSRTVEALRERLDAARGTAARLAGLERDLAAETLVPMEVARILAAAREVERSELRQSAALPSIVIKYLPGAEGSIAVAGRSVAVSGPLPLASETVLDIAGIGRIAVKMPSEATGAIDAEVARAQGQLTRLLASHEAVDLAAVEGRAARREDLSRTREIEAARLALVAPDGVSVLSQQLAVSSAQLDALGGVEAAEVPGDSGAVESEIGAFRGTIRGLDVAIRRLGDEIQAAATAQATLTSERAAAVARLASLRTKLPDAASLPRAITAAQDAVARARTALDDVLRQQGAWERGMLSVQAMLDLQGEAETAQQAIDDAARRRQQLALDIRGLASELKRDRQDGVEAQLEEARAALISVQAQVTRFDEQLAELQLLDRMLAEAAQSSLATELAPVIERLQGYARHVFPHAAVKLGDKLLPAALVRDGLPVPAGQLSVGTREQIAILVRLAYARLLADRGQQLPLLLDDALVYADTARFRSMMAVIKEATAHHQVIMLTCQEDRVAALGAQPAVTVVAMTPWSPDATARPRAGAAA